MKHIVLTGGLALILLWPWAGAVTHGQVQAQPQPQTPPRDTGKPVPPPTGAARISGVVKDQASEPVRRAKVTISGDMRLDRMTATDEAGRFAFASLPSGRFTISAEKAGYPRVSHGAKRAYRPGAGIFLQDGEHASDIALTLSRGAVLTGTVYDEDGVPMPGVPVMAWEVRTALNGERTLDFGAGPEPVTYVTDDRGVYRVYGLAPGVYTLGTSWFYHGQAYEVRTPTPAELRAAFAPANQATAPARPQSTPAPEPPRYNYAPVFSPGVLEPLSADTFTLKAGEERAGVDLRMQFQPTSRVEGTITNPAGTPFSVSLLMTRRHPVKALNTTQERPGYSSNRFMFDSLSPGLYTVIARSRDAGAGAMMWAMADLSLVGGDPTEVALSLQPAATVTGHVVFEGDALPAPPDLSRLSVRLSEIGPGLSGTSTKIDAAGAVSIIGVIPGQFMLSASVPGGLPPTGPGWTVRAVTVGGRDVTDRPFDLSAGGASDLVVTFTSQVSELSGTLTTAGGAEETDYFVIAIPADRAYWQPQSRRIVSTRPDGKGRYVFRGLPAGDYLIAVTTDLVARDLQEASTLESLAAQSLPVTLAFGERKALNIKTSGS